MRLILDKQCVLIDAPPQVQDQLKAALTMKNPAYIEARKHGRWTGKIDKVLRFYDEAEDGSLSFPRGFIRGALDIIGKDFTFQDDRRILPPVNFKFTGELRPYQDEVVQDLVKKDFGVLGAATGSGKTICALVVMAVRRQPTLFLVHTKELLYQARDRIAEFLGVDAGLIGDGKLEIKSITVGIVNTVSKHLAKLPQCFGQIVIDECAHTPSTMFSEVVKAFDCKYMLGLSATPYRRDKLTNLIYWYIGPLVHKIDSSELQDMGAVLIPEIIHKQTDFYYNFRDDYAKMLKVLTQDQERNELIVADIISEVRAGRGMCLVVSDRVEHCHTLVRMLFDRGVDVADVRLLTGQVKADERREIVIDVNIGQIKILIATIQLVGEGLDIERLSSLFLATPIKFSGRLIQVVGRILRPADGKTPKVYDYLDKIGPLYASARAREKTYREMRWIE